MIESKKEYYEFLKMDALANYRTSINAKVIGDYIWKYIITLRKRQYYSSLIKNGKWIGKILYKINDINFKRLGIKLGFSIYSLNIGKGLSLPHYGTIVVNSQTVIGNNCRIHQGVTIGSTNGDTNSAVIGDNVFIGSNVSIIGNIMIADNVAIGAGAVCIKDILEKGTTWGGCPAKKISNKDSILNLSPKLFK